MAANLAIQRPPWELHANLREELSTNLSNRSAAYFETGDYISALVDAELVIQIRKQWSKGYFRKAKALVKIDQLYDAKETVQAGLAHEPENVVRHAQIIHIPTSDVLCRKCLSCWRVSTRTFKSVYRQKRVAGRTRRQTAWRLQLDRPWSTYCFWSYPLFG